MAHASKDRMKKDDERYDKWKSYKVTAGIFLAYDPR
jgi:hypothetical protein